MGLLWHSRVNLVHSRIKVLKHYIQVAYQMRNELAGNEDVAYI